MDREKVIKGLEAIREFFGFGLPSQTPVFEAYQNILTDALAMLKEQGDSCWISVNDKLPARNTNVLWWCVLRDRHMGHVRIGFYEGITNHDIPEVSCCGPNCIPLYWMPMPNVPTEATIDASGNWCCEDGERKEGR